MIGEQIGAVERNVRAQVRQDQKSTGHTRSSFSQQVIIFLSRKTTRLTEGKRGAFSLLLISSAISRSRTAGDQIMHLYNAWLPPPVAAETIRERDSFASVVRSVKQSWRSDDPESVYSTLKWISVVELCRAVHANKPINTGPEGWRLRQRHFEAVTSLVQSCRKFFPSGSAAEIWSEFRDWIKQCLNLWDSVPNCQFWDMQWAAVMARCIKHYKSIDWECFLPVPVASGSGSNPFSVDVPRNTRFLFSSKLVTPAKAIAKSIVYLLKPGGSAQEYFEKMANLLEQNTDDNGCAGLYLGRPERAAFVRALLKLIDRGQYSKNESLSETVAAATSLLAYVEPSLVLPFLASRFHLALETQSGSGGGAMMTATHQLKIAVTSVAFSGRALFLASVSAPPATADALSADAFTDLIIISLNNALLGMDANDPPKTLATMQLIGSVFSNLAALDDNEDGPAFLSAISSEWLDEFFCRLFSLLMHLEPSSVLNEGSYTSTTSGTFLVEDGPYYFCMLEILLGKLSKTLYSQALKKIAKFVNTNILPGAIAEVGLLCCACVHSNPEEAAVHLIEPILKSVISSLKGTPVSGFGGRGVTDGSFSSKASLSPALETAIDYQLKVLSAAISYGGPVLLQYGNQLKEAIASAFEAPSWKVNGAGDHVLRSLLASLVLYYPVDQHKCILRHPAAAMLEEWISTKDYQNKDPSLTPKWHIPSEDEVFLANELLDLHFKSALDDLLKICQEKIHSDPGNEKEHLKVTLLRIDSSLQGVLSCLPDFRPSSRNDGSEDVSFNSFIIAGASGSTVGSPELRSKAAEVIHVATKYLLEKRSDDSILFILIIRIIDALGNFGSLEYDEWSNHKQSWKLESAAIIEPPTNFIVSSHAPGKRRPRWALIDKAYMHNIWRSSQSLYHLFRTNYGLSPSEHAILLMDDLLALSSHNYETVRSLAGKSLLKMLKRWPFLTGKCVLALAENLGDANAPEHVVLGSCAILATQTVLRHLTMIFVKYNIHFSGVPKNILRTPDDMSERSEFVDLVSQISSMSFNTNGLHWRYNLMANRALLLLTMASRSDSVTSSMILAETAGHFLKSLRSQLPHTRMLAISALNILLRQSPHKISAKECCVAAADHKEPANSSFEGALSKVFQEEGFFSETLNSLAHVHVITDADGTSSRGNHGAASFQSLADKSTTRFYFDFSASWPRTPSWISLLGGDTFYSNFARIFKRLIQECGMPVLLALQNALEEFSDAKERSRQCVAAEALAGVLHSDIIGLIEAWDNWLMNQFEKIILAPSVDSTPEWAACIRYAVTGKGKYGTRIPILRQKILDCLLKPLPQSVATSIAAKRYAFLSASLIELSPPRMPVSEVREAVGVTLSVLCSNLRLFASFSITHVEEGRNSNENESTARQKWDKHLVARASELATNIQNANQLDNGDCLMDITHESASLNDESREDVKWMETVREHAAAVLAGLLKGGDEDIAKGFHSRAFSVAHSIQKKRKHSQSIAYTHGAVLALAASVLSVPYDMPRCTVAQSWLPDHVTLLARFIGEPSPIRSTVTKAVAEFRRTHADTWNFQKDSFTEDQLEVLADTSSSSSYFA
ncbi:hypothetical protein ACLOJK_015372 [Asimina triloba]